MPRLTSSPYDAARRKWDRLGTFYSVRQTCGGAIEVLTTDEGLELWCISGVLGPIHRNRPSREHPFKLVLSTTDRLPALRLPDGRPAPASWLDEGGGTLLLLDQREGTAWGLDTFRSTTAGPLPNIPRRERLFLWRTPDGTPHPVGSIALSVPQDRKAHNAEKRRLEPLREQARAWYALSADVVDRTEYATAVQQGAGTATYFHSTLPTVQLAWADEPFASRGIQERLALVHQAWAPRRHIVRVPYLRFAPNPNAPVWG